MTVYLKLSVKNSLTLIVISLGTFFFFFMNVTKLDPFGKIFLRINMKLILLLQTWTKFLVFLETISDLFIFFCCKNLIYSLEFQHKRPAFSGFKILVEIIESVNMLCKKVGKILWKNGDLTQNCSHLIWMGMYCNLFCFDMW